MWEWEIPKGEIREHFHALQLWQPPLVFPPQNPPTSDECIWTPGHTRGVHKNPQRTGPWLEQSCSFRLLPFVTFSPAALGDSCRWCQFSLCSGDLLLRTEGRRMEPRVSHPLRHQRGSHLGGCRKGGHHFWGAWKCLSALYTPGHNLVDNIRTFKVQQGIPTKIDGSKSPSVRLTRV